MDSKQKNSLEKKFKIKVPFTVVKSKMEENFLELSKTLKISGFRPGKVPISFVKNRYEKEVLSKVTENIIQEEGNKSFEKKGYRLATQPKVTLLSKMDNEKDLEAEFEFEILPEINLGDFSKFEFTNYKSKVDDKDINKIIENLYNDYKDFKDGEINKKATNGDRLIISYKGFLDGVEFEEGSAEKQVIDLGKNNYLPEFEKNLIGKKKNEYIEFDMIFPENYNNDKLKGKKVKFKITINNLMESIKLKSEEELAKKTGAKNSKELREKIKGELKKYSEDLSFNLLKKDIVEKLISNYEFELPKTLVNKEIELIKNNIASKKNEDKRKVSEKIIEKEAKDKVKLGLIISEIGIRNKINVSNKEIETELTKICMQYPGKEREIIEYYKANPNYMNSIKGPIFEDKVMKFVAEKSKIKEKVISSDDLMKKSTQNQVDSKKSKKKGDNEK